MWTDPAQNQPQGIRNVLGRESNTDADLSTLDSYMALGEDQQQAWMQQMEQRQLQSSTTKPVGTPGSSSSSTGGPAQPVNGSSSSNGMPAGTAAGSDGKPAMMGRSATPGSSSIGSSSSAAYSRRMFSASDPIRGGSEWRLPWQVRASRTLGAEQQLSLQLWMTAAALVSTTHGLGVVETILHIVLAAWLCILLAGCLHGCVSCLQEMHGFAATASQQLRHTTLW
jgi:hypothetical protein